MRLVGIHVYPIKSCRGTPMGEARVAARGLHHDRRWMVTDPEGGFLTQRKHPRMALIEPRLEGEALRVSAPGAEPLLVPVDAPGPRTEVAVWRSRSKAIDQGDDAATWFSEFLETPCRFVRQADDAGRAVLSRVRQGRRTPVAFADRYPFLLTTVESLGDLNERMPEALPMDRFRPNLVVAGGRPFEEDAWRRIRVGAVRFSVEKPCARCAITTVDQRTAARGAEPLRTLGTYRRGPRGVLFGQNLVHEGEGVLREGADVVVLETREPVRVASSSNAG